MIKGAGLFFFACLQRRGENPVNAALKRREEREEERMRGRERALRGRIGAPPSSITHIKLVKAFAGQEAANQCVK